VEHAPAISIRDLRKSYGAVEAVRGVTFDVAQGEIFGFLGLNGAGKTTTIRILLDLLRPSAGSAALFGIDCQRDSRKARALVGYLPGELGFYADMTGRELLDLTAGLSGRAVSHEYRRQLADRLELSRADFERRLREYSTGMKRKLGIIQALQADPELLILDEPTEGLDPLVQEALNGVLLDLRARGRTVFMSSHVLSEVERLCDRIAVISSGQLVLLSTVDDARRLGGRRVRVHFNAPVELSALPEGVTLLDRRPQRWTLNVEKEVGPLLTMLGPLPVSDLQIDEPALEDVLRRFYRADMGSGVMSPRS
jgi:ABC-2 type transport system ATP-binding protein